MNSLLRALGSVALVGGLFMIMGGDGVWAAIANGDFETAPVVALPNWLTQGGSYGGPPGTPPTAPNAARIADGLTLGIPIGVGSRGTGISQCFDCDRLRPDDNCYIRFDALTQRPMAQNPDLFVAVNGKAGLMFATIPNNNGAYTAYQVIYPSCDTKTIVFGYLDPAGAVTSNFYLDNVKDQCNTPHSGTTTLPWDSSGPPPSRTELHSRLAVEVCSVPALAMGGLAALTVLLLSAGWFVLHHRSSKQQQASA